MVNRPYDTTKDLNDPTYGQDWHWVFIAAFTPDDPGRFNEDTMKERLRKTIECPGMEIEQISISHW